MKLTKNELEVMDTLWQAKRPLPRNEIIELSPDRSWSASTIHILLNSLLEKGAIEEVGFIKRGKTYGRLYSPKLTVEEYWATTLFTKKNAIPMYFSAFLKCDTVTMDMISELEDLLAQRKKELSKKDKVVKGYDNG